MITKPCGLCPFKKNSFKGYLGGFTIEETLQTARSESSFICHKVRDSTNEDECAGRFLFASKTAKSFRNPFLENRRKELLKFNDLDNILAFDFKEHHNIEE
jgi:hypothetical protein